MWKHAQQAAWRRRTAALALLLWLAGTCVGAKEREPGPRPALRIPVQPLGYHQPGKLYLLAHYSSSSLDFLDPTHLLFTFRESRLLQRTERSTGLDQAIHAVVLELPAGKVVHEAEWTLPDRQRYAWPLNHGEVLLRMGDDLYATDAQLALKPLLHVPSRLREVDTSPDGRMLIIESDVERHTPEEHARLKQHAEAVGADMPAEDVSVQLVSMDERKVKLTAHSERVGNLPATAEGFFGNEQLPGERWNVRFHPLATAHTDQGSIVAQVASTCQPEEHVLSANNVLVMSCPPKHGDRYAAVYSLNGRKLWDGRWQANFAWPAFRIARNGTTLAISWLAVSRPVGEFDAFDDNEVQAQVLTVLDSKTGGLRMALALDPVISAGGNFAVSADGNRLAVLNRGAVEVYDLPAAAPETERAAQ